MDQKTSYACILSALLHSLYLLLHHPFLPRMAPFDGSAWEEEDDEPAPPPDVPYYNNFPGKQPPPGGLIDMRTRPGATLVSKVHINTAGGRAWRSQSAQMKMNE